MNESTPLRDLLGQDAPIGPGTLRRDDPLIITERVDYVSVERYVSKRILESSGLEYKFETSADAPRQ